MTGGPASHLSHVDDLTPMPVHRSDGWEQVDIRFLLPPELQQDRALLALFRAVFPPGARHLAHTHPHAPEFVYVVAGEPVIGDADGQRIGRPGTVQLVPAGAVHWLWNTSETTVEVLGGYLGVRTFADAGYEPIGQPPA